MLALAGVVPAWLRATSPAAEAQPGKTRLGGTPAAFTQRARGGGAAASFDIVGHCHRIGLGGVQTSLESNDVDPARELRKRVEGYGMQLVLGVPQLPGEESQLFRFDNALKTCKAAGDVLSPRGIGAAAYEQFDSREAFQRTLTGPGTRWPWPRPFSAGTRSSWPSRLPVGAPPRPPAWLKDLGSDWIGVCFDFGNHMALCEDPMEALRILAPYTLMGHIKDIAVDTYEEGFLLSEVALGEGILDLKEMVRILREKDAEHALLPRHGHGRSVEDPGSHGQILGHLRRFLKPAGRPGWPGSLVSSRSNPPKKPLPRVTGLSPEAALKFEDENNLKCIEYARQVLSI